MTWFRPFLVFVFVLAVSGFVAAPVFASEGGSGAKKEAKGDHGGEGEGEAGKKGERFSGDPVYVHLAPMVLPVISDEGVQQLVTIQIDVEVKDYNTADEMHSNMPKVMDALMRALYGGLGTGSLRKGKLVDVSKVKAKATAAMEEVLGAENVRNVLIQGVSQRML